MRKTTLFVAVIVSFILTLPCIVGAAEWDPYGLNIVSNYDNNRTNDRNYKDFIFDVSEDNFYYLSFMSHIPDLDNPQYCSFDISIDGENSWYADAVGSGWTQFVVSSWEPIWLARGQHKVSIITDGIAFARVPYLAVSNSDNFDLDEPHFGVSDDNGNSMVDIIPPRNHNIENPIFQILAYSNKQDKLEFFLHEGEIVHLRAYCDRDKDGYVDAYCEKTWRPVRNDEVILPSNGGISPLSNGMVDIGDDTVVEDVTYKFMHPGPTQSAGLSWRLPLSENTNDFEHYGSRKCLKKDFKAPVEGIYVFYPNHISIFFNYIENAHKYDDQKIINPDQFNTHIGINPGFNEGEEYAVIALNKNTSSPQIKMMIYGGINDRVIAFTDSMPRFLKIRYKLNNNDVALQQSFSYPVTGFKVISNYNGESNSNYEANITIVAVPVSDDIDLPIVPIFPTSKNSKQGNYAQNKVTVSPNPAEINSTINISGISTPSQVSAFGLGGEFKGCISKYTSDKEIGVKELGISSEGIYVLLIENEESTSALRLIVK